MISFRIGDEFLHAPQGTRLRIRFVSPAPFPGQDPEIVIPISLPVTFQDNPHNRRLLKYSNQLNNIEPEAEEIPCTLYFDGTPLFPGFLMPSGPTDSDFRMSFVYDTLQQKGETPLKDMDLGNHDLIEGTFDAQMQDLNIPARPVRVFPIWNEKFCEDYQPASPIMEIHKFQNFLNDNNEFEFYDGWPAVTPFLRVQFLIEKISEFLFLYDDVIESEFYKDLLGELVLYSNNSIVDSDTLIIDSSVIGDTFTMPANFPLASQAPDQNIAEFLMHFGLYFCGGFFFNINYSKATFRHMADVIKQQPARDWTNYISHSYELPIGDRFYGRIVAEPRGNKINGADVFFDVKFFNVRSIMFASALYPGYESGKPFTAYIKFLNLTFLIKPGSDVFEFYYIRKLNYDNISIVDIDSRSPEIKIQAGALHNWAPTFDQSLIPDSQVYSRPVPVIESKGHLQNIQEGDEIDPIFMFFRGIVTTNMTDPDNHFGEIDFDYTCGSSFSHIGSSTGPLPLSLLLNSSSDLEETLYKHLWRPWNDHLRANKVVKARFKLPLREILNFSFDQVIRAGNMNYLLKSLEVVLSDRGVEPCVAEMVGCAQAGEFPFDPVAEVPGMALWLDAQDTETVHLVSSKVEKWDDKSGNARHFVQATDGNRPTFANGINDIPAIMFDAGSQFLAAQVVLGITGTQERTIFIVAQPGSGGHTSSQVMFEVRTGTSASNAWIVGLYQSVKRLANFWGLINISATALELQFREPYVICQDHDGSSTTGSTSEAGIGTGTTFYVNSAPIPFNAVSSHTHSLSESAPPRIGESPGSPGNAFNGFIGEIMVWPRKLTDTERTEVTNYLLNKWKITP